MSEVVTITDLTNVFEVAAGCVGASNCKKTAEAMVSLYQRNNQMTIESGKGLLLFCAKVDEVCPNQDQLLCQDRLSGATE